MNIIHNYIEPTRLLVSWQQPQGTGEGFSRARLIVAEIVQNEEDIAFHYLVGTPDFDAALKVGFAGLPAFKLNNESHTSSVMDTFMRRIPPRKREDFKEYLDSFKLPHDFTGSEFSLLSHTGAKLPGDGFEIFPDLEGYSSPFELIMEVAGTRHVRPNLDNIQVGDSITLLPVNTNPYDENAVIVVANGELIGFVPKPYNKAFKKMLATQKLVAVIDRLDKAPTRPLIFLYIKVT